MIPDILIFSTRQLSDYGITKLTFLKTVQDEQNSVSSE